MEVDEFDFAVIIFYQRGATLDPVPAVEIVHLAEGFNLCAMMWPQMACHSSASL